MKAVATLVQAVVVLVGANWAFTLVLAQTTCSAISWIGPHCTDGKGEIWMVPFFTAAFGLPALIASIFIVGLAIRRQRARSG
jgi:hypothetical protein